jgi:hypothetical protein
LAEQPIDEKYPGLSAGIAGIETAFDMYAFERIGRCFSRVFEAV